jgi:hypothetical protein
MLGLGKIPRSINEQLGFRPENRGHAVREKKKEGAGGALQDLHPGKRIGGGKTGKEEKIYPGRMTTGKHPLPVEETIVIQRPEEEERSKANKGAQENDEYRINVF